MTQSTGAKAGLENPEVNGTDLIDAPVVLSVICTVHLLKLQLSYFSFFALSQAKNKFASRPSLPHADLGVNRLSKEMARAWEWVKAE